jgi:hypothetical protein
MGQDVNVGLLTDVAKLALTSIQGFLGVDAAQSEANAVAEQTQEQIAELERQKIGVAVKKRAEMSDRMREADRQFASMVVAMADNGGLGTVNAGGLAGSIGYVTGVDMSRIQYNANAEIASLTASQRAARRRAINAQNKSRGQVISSIIQTGAGITTVLAGQAERQRQLKKQKNTATAPKTSVNVQGSKGP